MTDLILRFVLLWAILAILLHLGLILYAMFCQTLNWWESPWGRRGETVRRIMAWSIIWMILCALLIGCASQCRPKIPPDRTPHLIPTHILDSVLDSGIVINCEWSY